MNFKENKLFNIQNNEVLDNLRLNRERQGVYCQTFVFIIYSIHRAA